VEAIVQSYGDSAIGAWRCQDVARLSALRAVRVHTEPVGALCCSLPAVVERKLLLVLHEPDKLAGSELYARRAVAEMCRETLGRRGFVFEPVTVSQFLAMPLTELWKWAAVVSIYPSMQAVVRRLWGWGAWGPRIVGLINTSPSDLDQSRCADLVLSNTEHEAKPSLSAGSTVVMHPPCYPPGTRSVVRRRGAVVQVNLAAQHKRPEVFEHLARVMPGQSFIAVAGAWGHQRIPKLPNVEEVACGERSVWEALERASLLILPSTEETYGMVAAEALLAGVPVLVSDLPGPREAVIDPIFVQTDPSLQGWEASVRRMLAESGSLDDRVRATASELETRQARETARAIAAFDSCLNERTQ
jgi:hypothetical protein